ncbi:MAG: outer membrane protein assembly factor BamA [Rickettsiales bacterium]|nr:outer membrane protein assembly factor BamA [Rickettsiales bacterium]
MKNRYIRPRSCLYLFLGVLLFSINAFATEYTINKIVFDGNRRYNDIEYAKYVGVEIGDNFAPEKSNEIVKNLYSSGLVDDVHVEFKNNVLHIRITEKEFVKKITFVGNKKLKDDTIKENLKLKVKEAFSYKLLNEDLEFINGFYKQLGMFNTKVDYEIKKDDNNLVEVVFTVKESKKSRIKNIYFIGNNVYGADKLKDVLFSRENRFYRFGKRINYDSNMLEYDSYMLRMFYLSSGYIDFDINSVNGKFNSEDNTFDIVFDINEGEKYTFGNVDVVDNFGNIDVDIVKGITTIKSGKVFNLSVVNGNVDKITDYLYDLNNRFFIVNMQILPNKTLKTVNVNFVIDKTEKYYVGKIKIKNNSRTLDSVIRRKLTILEGDPYDEKEIEKSLRKIRNLGFFKSVSYSKTESLIKNQYDITIKVEEQSTGSATFGVGYSSSYGINGSVELSERNLLGTGNSLNFGVRVNKYNNYFSFGYTVPNIFDTNVVGGFRLFYQKLNNIKNSNSNLGYNKMERSARIFATYDITDFLSQTLSYSFKYYELDNVVKAYDGILSNRDDRISEISMNLSYDRRDSYYNTTSGYLLSYDIDYAGLFGNKDYLKNTFYAAYYYPLYSDKLILKVEGKYAKIKSINNNPLFPDDGFYLGGYNMRGFESGGVGPRVKGNELLIGDYGLSGTTLYYFNTEVKFPLFLPQEFQIFGIFFFNAGCVTGIEDNPKVNKSLIYDDNNMRSAAGFSILWQLPIGNLSLDFSKTIKKENYDQDEHFRFNIGTMF